MTVKVTFPTGRTIIQKGMSQPEANTYVSNVSLWRDRDISIRITVTD